MSTIFSRVKAELANILNVRLVEPGLAMAVLGARSRDENLSPFIILSTGGYQERQHDMSDEVYIIVSTVARFINSDGEAAAEEALDNIEAVIFDLFKTDGEYQVHRGHWAAVDFNKRSIRPFSPIGPRFRYGEIYLKFVI